MCGRFVAASSPDEVASYFGAEPPSTQLSPNWNVAPTVDVHAVVEAAPDSSTSGSRLLETFHWGLVPLWAKDEKIGNRMINARSETVATKNAYRSAFKRRRCIIPADGFYEWKAPATKGEKKQPFFIHRPDGEPLAMAGLWERWRGPDRDRPEALHSCTVITTSANEFMSTLHDRMPVMLAPDDWDRWLDPENDDVDDLMELLVPAPEGLLTAHMVDPAVGNVRNKGPELAEPWSPPEG